MAQILEYILVEPPNPNDQRRCLKLPLLACKVLSQTTDKTNKFFIKQGTNQESVSESENFKYFKILLDFILKNPPLNPVLSGYIAKVLTARLSNDPLATYSYVFRHPEYLDRLEALFSDASITNVTGVLVKENLERITEDSKDPKLKPLWDEINVQRALLFERVFKRFLATSGDMENLEEHGNLADIILETMDNVLELNFELKPTFLSQIITSVKGVQSDTLGDVPSIINKVVSMSLKYNALKTTEINTQDIEELIRFLTTSVAGLAKEEPGKPLGRKGYQVIECLDALTSLDIPAIQDSLNRQGTLNNLPKLFLIYPWHNLLHNKIVNIFTKVMKDLSSSLGLQLLTEGNLVRTLADGAERCKNLKVKPSYNSHFLHICELLMSTSHEQILKQLHGDPEWKNLKEEFYLATLSKLGLSSSGIRAKKSTEYFEYFFSLEEVTDRFKNFLQPAKFVNELSMVAETVDPIEPHTLPNTPVKILSFAGRRSMEPEEIGNLLASMSPMANIPEVCETPSQENSPLPVKQPEIEISIKVISSENTNEPPFHSFK